MMSASSSYSNDVTSLHFAIADGDIDEVKRLLIKLPVDKHYYDARNNSAAAVAIKNKNDKIYDLLCAKGIFLGLHEWMDEVTSGLKRSRKEKLRDIHRKYFNDPNLKHLANLITSTKLSHETSPSDRREHLRLITEAFEDLNGLQSIEPILKVASTSPKLKIVFDFNRDSVEFLDPVKSRNVMGTSYTENCIIYVGAKDLKDKGKRCEVLGVLIHELTHFVMKLIYDNEAKPYKRGDLKKLNKFSQVFIDTANKKESEPYIKIVYEYPESRHHAELIVRVPHLTALFMDDEDKTIEVHAEFSELFDFYEEIILVDLKREFPLKKVKHEIRELNELCGTLAILGESDIEMSPQALDGLDLNSISNDKILFISSNCPQLTLSAVFQQVCSEIDFETSFVFADLKLMKSDKIFDLVVKALELFTNPRLIIDCQDVVKFDEVTGIVNKLNENKINEKVIFILNDKKFNDSCDAEPFKVVHSWNHLTSTFQRRLLRKKIEFQGAEMVIGVFLNDPSSMQSIPFQDLLDDKAIVIGKNPEFETEKLIERKFLPSNSKIKSRDFYTIEHDFDDFLTFTKKYQTILISDEPGMGKSTSLELLQTKLRQKNPLLWPVFMDLKDHCKAYQVPCLEVRKRENIAKFFTEKVLKIESFEAEIFTKLFNEHRVVFLLDGLDEICPSYKRFIFSLMKDIQNFSKNHLWISTRPHLVEELRKELNPIEFTLKPFTEENRREFFEKHFKGDPNFELILQEIESFLKKLRNDVCNPLVIRMIVEIIDEGRIFKLSEANMFVIYDSFTKKMIEKCQEKGSEAKKDIVNWIGNSNVVEFFQQQAFLTCFNYGDNALNRIKLIDPQFLHVEKPPLDETVRIGLMFANSPEKLHFIHRTFAEFYVAKFFYEMIFKFTNLRAENHLNATIEFLFQVVFESNEYHFIRVLLDNAVDSDKKLSVRRFPPSTFKIVKEEMELKHFKYLLESGCYNLIEFFVLHLHPDAQKVLFTKDLINQNLVMVAVEYQSMDFFKQFFDLLKDFNNDELKKMLVEQDKNGQNVLSVAALNPNSGVFEYLIDFCESFMTSEKLNDLLMQTYESVYIRSFDDFDYNTNILHSAFRLDRHLEVIIKVLTLKLSPDQQKTMLVAVKNRNGSNLLQQAVQKRNSVSNCECLFVFIRKALGRQDMKKFLLHENYNGLKAFDLALLNDNEIIFGSIRKLYLEVFGEDKKQIQIFGRNNCENWFQESSLYFQRICPAKRSIYDNSYCDGTFKKFASFIMELFAADSLQKEFFLIKNNKGETFLEFGMKNLRKDDFTFLCSLLNTNDRAEILQHINSRGECAFHSAARRDKIEIFRKVRQLYEKSFKKEKFRQMIVSCDKSWMLDTVECYSYQNSGTLAELCHCLRDLFKGTEETEELKSFFLFADEEGQTALMAAAKGENKFEYLFDLTKELYDIETVKEFLLIKDIPKWSNCVQLFF